MFGRIVAGLSLMVVGFVIIFFSAKISEFVGRIRRMDECLGGTRTGILLGGFMLAVIGGMLAVGFIGFSDPASSITSGVH